MCSLFDFNYERQIVSPVTWCDVLIITVYGIPSDEPTMREANEPPRTLQSPDDNSKPPSSLVAQWQPSGHKFQSSLSADPAANRNDLDLGADSFINAMTSSEISSQSPSHPHADTRVSGSSSKDRCQQGQTTELRTPRKLVTSPGWNGIDGQVGVD